MKSILVITALAAGLAAAAPSNADAAGLSVGISANNGNVAGHLVLVDHDRGYRRGPRHHGRRLIRRCESWRFAHRKLHRRFHDVELQRRLRNRRGDLIFVARAHNQRGYPVRVRYNACLGRVMNVVRVRGHRYHRGPQGHGRNWDRGHRRQR